MKGTCLKEKCIFWEQHESDGKVCPFHRETIWSNAESNQPIVCEDCAPVRSMFMQMDDHNNTIGVKKLTGEIRNSLAELKKETSDFMISHGSALNSMKRNTEQVLLEVSKKGEQHDIPALPNIRL